MCKRGTAGFRMSRSARRLYANSTQIPSRRYLYRSHTSAEPAVAPAVAAAAVAVPAPALAAVDVVAAAAAAAVASPVPSRPPEPPAVPQAGLISIHGKTTI